ncbi:hypothetical protein SAMN04487905_10639 [Actinopolyspora xinjiangensis]|uniref:Uncharacterized protein n=1 Tax=Actinopolyspora xinjiangensis TaxID=405564 RepID=A0A1H0U4M0_9ACTN|nr:hypothetical protein [Actinopolyspora xinjiangensis]SDP61010.1 hypothetical protein SAMN04487905_10639 [Actinopolyspora xinjiangensis]
MSTHPLSSFEQCPACGKKVYNSRRSARQAAKAHHPGKHLNAYRCPRSLEWDSTRWHVGHLRAPRDYYRQEATA